MGRPCCIQLADASCEASAYTSEHRQLQLHGPTRFIEICIKAPGIRISSHCWFLPHPPAALKKTLKKTPTIRKNVCTNMHRLNLATSTIVHLLENYPRLCLSCSVRIFCGFALHSALLRFVLIRKVTKWKVKHFVLLLLQSASIAVENVDNPNSRTQSKPQATTPAGKGRNQQAQSTTRPTNGQLQTFLG